jgi:hypothetical protein
MIFLLIISFFTPFFHFGNFEIPFSYLIVLFISILGYIDIYKKKTYQKILFFLSLFLIYTFLVASINFFIYSSLDLRGISGAFMGFVALGASNYIKNRLGNFNYSKAVRILNLPLLLNNIIIIMLFNIDNFKIFFYSLISVNPRMFDYPIPRYSGFSYDGFSYASTFNAVYFLLLLLFLINKKLTSTVKFLTFVNLALTILTTILVGRTGVGLILIGILLFIIFYLYFTSLKNKINFILKLTIFIFIFSIIIVLVINSISELPMFEYINYGFKFYTDTFDSGEINDSSINDISSNMFFLPENLSSIFFGEGNFGRASNYIPSDVGFVLGIHGFGIIGLFFYLISFFSIINFHINKESNNFLNSIIYTISFLLILVNFKDYYIFYPIGHFILLFTVVFYLKSDEFKK